LKRGLTLVSGYEDNGAVCAGAIRQGTSHNSSRVKASSAPIGSSMSRTWGVVYQRAAQARTLPHSARKLPGRLPLKTLQSDDHQQIDRLLNLPRQVQNLNRQQHVVYDVAPRQQEWILERHSDALGRPVEPRPAKQNFTTGGREQAAEELEQPVFRSRPAR
jgi:hypothetical protein